MKLRTTLPITAMFATLALNSCPTKKATNLPNTTRCDSCLSGSVSWTPNITYKQAAELAENYANDIGKKYIFQNGRASTQRDALNIHFNLTEMKEFIKSVERNACKYNCNDLLGIRIYYGRYPNRDSMIVRGWNPNYADHHTVFMVPTYWDADSNRNIDFNDVLGCRVRIDTSKAGMVFSGINRGASDGKNHGGIMPPPENEGNYPTN